jgi:hypothetical protein
MNRTARLIAGAALGLVISVGAQATEKKINQSDLPTAVQKTADQQIAGATVTGYTKDKVEGNVVYQMNLLADGRAKGIVIGADGTLVSVEEEIAWDRLPADVKTDFTNVTGKGTLGSVSSVTKDGKVVAYKALRVTNGVRDHVQVKPHALVLESVPAADTKS